MRPNKSLNTDVQKRHFALLLHASWLNSLPLVSERVELPSDISGIVYGDDANWQIEIAKEMKGAGYADDFNKIVES